MLCFVIFEKSEFIELFCIQEFLSRSKNLIALKNPVPEEYPFILSFT